MVPLLLYSLVLTAGSRQGTGGCPLPSLTTQDLRSGPSPRALAPFRVRLSQASCLRWLLSTSLFPCGTTSHGPLWAVGLVWGFCAETVQRGPFCDPGGSTARLSLLIFESLLFSIPSMTYRQLPEMVWTYPSSVQNDNSRAATGRKVTAGSLLWPQVWLNSVKLLESFHSASPAYEKRCCLPSLGICSTLEP